MSPLKALIKMKAYLLHFAAQSSKQKGAKPPFDTPIKRRKKKELIGSGHQVLAYGGGDILLQSRAYHH